MDIRIKPSALSGKICAPPSKSYLHRALILAAFGDKPCLIKGAAPSDDITATANALQSFGAQVSYKDNAYKVSPVLKAMPCADIFCNESGSTLRFLLPFAAMFSRGAAISGAGRLAERPIESALNALSANGARFDGGKLPIKVTATCNKGDFHVDCSQSSQFLSGMLMALGALGGGTVYAENGLVSAEYVDITAEVLKAFGVNIVVDLNKYTLIGKLVSPDTLTVPGDWSNGAVWLAASAFSGVTVDNLDAESAQGDKKIIDYMRSNGTTSVNSERAVNNTRNPYSYDVTHCPDLAPVMAFLAAGANGLSVLTGVERLRIKESDRLSAIIDTLTKAGVYAEYEGGSLMIKGGKVRGCELDSYGDHRIVMLGVLLSLLSDSDVVIRGAEALNKSYPRFLDDFHALGGKYDVIGK